MMLTSAETSVIATSMLVPMSLGLSGVCVLDEQGHETPMTEEMILRACEDLLRKLQTPASCN
ncbi:MAG: hypothetical protein HKM02_07370 [Pseudomonadales bacterium]|nr:hypothetical protein [Pseudomonadales bacterium]